MERRIAARAIIVHEGKLLAVQLKAYNERIAGEYWCTIGGGIDSQESIIPALTREVFEETGVQPVVAELLFVQQFIGGGKEHVEFFFHITNTSDFMDIDLSKTSHGAEEIDKLEFIDPSREVVYPEFLKSIDYTDLDKKPVQFFSTL